MADTEFQLIGDYVGKRYATYTNDLSVPSYFLMSLGVSGKLPFLNGGLLKNARYRVNISNLANREGSLMWWSARPAELTIHSRLHHVRAS